MDSNEYYERRGDTRMLGDGSLLCGRCFSELAERSATILAACNKPTESQIRFKCKHCHQVISDESLPTTKPNDTEILDGWNGLLNMIKRSMQE